MKKFVAIVIASCIMFVSGLLAQAQLDNAKELLKQGKAVDELVLLTAWEQTAGKIPSIGGIEDDPEQKALMECYNFARTEAEQIIQGAH